MFHTGEIRPGRVPPIPRDRGAHMADIETSATTAASQRRVLSFAVTSHLPKFWVTRLTEIHVSSPFRSSPCL